MFSQIPNKKGSSLLPFLLCGLKLTEITSLAKKKKSLTGLSPVNCIRRSVAKTLHDPIDGSMPGLPVPHHLPEFAQVHVH